jgi:ABC-type oligopeptide transport system ATPase subunit
MSALISVRGLTRVFDVSKPWLNRVIERLPRALLTAVSDVSFEIERNSVYALVGESGSGKSTIGKIMVGLVPPSARAMSRSKALTSRPSATGPRSKRCALTSR